MTKENRKYYRLPKVSKVEYTIVTYSSEETPKKKFTYKNISGGGLLFESDISIEPDELLKLDITLLGWHKKLDGFIKPLDSNYMKPLTALGKVVWSSLSENGKHDIGVKFIDIYEDDFKALIKFIEDKPEKDT